MTDVTIKQFAMYIGIPIDRLLEQFAEAGILLTDANALVTEEQKLILLAHLRKCHGNNYDSSIISSEPKKITLKRKTRSEIKMTGGTAGQIKTVSIEVRKKRTYIKRSLIEDDLTNKKPIIKSKSKEVSSVNIPLTEEVVSKNNILLSTLEKTSAATISIPASTETDLAELNPVKTDLVAEETSKMPIPVVIDEMLSPVNTSKLLAVSEISHNNLPSYKEGDILLTHELATKQKINKKLEKHPTELKSSRSEGISSIKSSEFSNSKSSKVPEKYQFSDEEKNFKGKKQQIITSKKKHEFQHRSSKLKDINNDISEDRISHRFPSQQRRLSNDKVENNNRKNKKHKLQKINIQPIITKHSFAKPTTPIIREVIIPETIRILDLAQKMSTKATEVIKTFLKMGLIVTINQIVDQDTAALVVTEMGHAYKLIKEDAIETELSTGASYGDLLPRPPVVTIMGHVDHGKTSLLDYIRKTSVAAGEAGGITQHIGAYHVQTPKGAITFLDTPGHSAFTAMRARGAKATDIIILVVAADDGVMPQTIEAIQHAKVANVPLVVAVNKMDKTNADPEKVKSDLSAQGILSEEWGGDVLFSYLSAKSGAGIENLLNQILLQAEMLELKAAINGPAKGIIIEARVDKGRGPISTILVQSGTLYKGDMILSGLEYGRVRAMMDEKGQYIVEAGPSIPVEVLGLSGLARAGDEVTVVVDERKAREIAIFRQNRLREQSIKLSNPPISLDDISKQFEAGNVNILNIVIRADVQGSTEAIVSALTQLSTNEVQVKIISSGIGGINESDINLAYNANAIVIGFNVRADNLAKKLSEESGLKLHYYSIIYELIDDVKKAMLGLLKPAFREEILGLAEVRSVFRSPKFGLIAGCMVLEGVVKRNNQIRLIRNNIIIFEGYLDSLRRFKEDTSEVRAGTECGIGIKNCNLLREGDVIEVFEKVQVERNFL